MQDEVKRILREEMDKRGWHDNDLRAGLAAIVGGESHFIPKFETGYGRTANSRIRTIFRSRVGGMPDAELDRLKASDERFFNFIYGAQFQGIHHLGNKAPGDGFKHRGGGLNQLTGLANYTRYGPKVGADLVNHPELVNAPRVAAAVAVEYMKDRFHGGDFNDMKAAVGISIGGPDEQKNQLYEEYTQTGEWNYKPGSSVVPDAGEGGDVGETLTYDRKVKTFLRSLHALQKFLTERNLYSGPIDDDPGPGTRLALKAYL